MKETCAKSTEGVKETENQVEGGSQKEADCSDHLDTPFVPFKEDFCAPLNSHRHVTACNLGDKKSGPEGVLGPKAYWASCPK